MTSGRHRSKGRGKPRHSAAPETPRVGGADLIDLMIAMIETEASRIASGDFSAAGTVLTRQGLALDALFDQLVREAATGTACGHVPMCLALGAQSQSRSTLSNLVSLFGPGSRGAKYFRKSSDQTNEIGNRAV